MRTGIKYITESTSGLGGIILPQQARKGKKAGGGMGREDGRRREGVAELKPCREGRGKRSKYQAVATTAAAATARI